MQIQYNNVIMNVEKGTKIIDLLNKEIVESNAIAARFNNEVKSLDYVLNEDGELTLIDISNKDGMRVYRKGLLFVIGKAIEELYPNKNMIVNYQLSNSLLCEFDNFNVTDDDIAKINAKVAEIVNADLPIYKKYMSKEDAKLFYQNENTDKGILQMDLKEKEHVTLYWCENYFNYFYGILPITTGAMKIYEIIKYHRGFLVRYPSKKDITKLPEFKEHKKLLATLDEYDLLHRVLDVPTVRKLNDVNRKGKIKDYILLDEALHEKKIANIADDIVKNDKIKMILIAGPSSSGKTTFVYMFGI